MSNNDTHQLSILEDQVEDEDIMVKFTEIQLERIDNLEGKVDDLQERIVRHAIQNNIDLNEKLDAQRQKLEANFQQQLGAQRQRAKARRQKLMAKYQRQINAQRRAA